MKIIELLKNNERLKHYVIYIIFGILTTLISLGAFVVLRYTLPWLNENIANILSILIAIVFAYFTNRKYVFFSNEKNKLKEFFKFFLGRLSAFVIEAILFWGLTEFTEINEIVVKLTGSFTSMVVNYVLSRFFVFKNSAKKV